MKFKMVLITDELNNNAIEYGSLEKDVNIMRISIKKDELYYYFVIEVEDS
jgi:two-component sensor histidine kinase